MRTARQNAPQTAHPSLQALQLQSRMERTLPPLSHEVSPPAFGGTTFQAPGDLFLFSCGGAMHCARSHQPTHHSRTIRFFAGGPIEKAEARESPERALGRSSARHRHK